MQREQSLSKSEGEQPQSESEGAVECSVKGSCRWLSGARKYRTKSGRRKCKKQVEVKADSDIAGQVSTWHRRLGHVSLNTMKKFFQLHDLRLPLTNFHFPICSVCSLRKLTTKV